MGCAHRHTQRNAAGWSYNRLAACFRDRHWWVFIGRWLMRSAMSRSCAGDIFPNLFPRVMSRTRAPAFSHVPRCCGEWGSVKKIVAPVACVMRACWANSPPLSAVMGRTTRRRGSALAASPQVAARARPIRLDPAANGGCDDDQPRRASAPHALAQPPHDRQPPRHGPTPPAKRRTRPRTAPTQSGANTSTKIGVPQSIFVGPSSVVCSSQPPFGGL